MFAAYVYAFCSLIDSGELKLYLLPYHRVADLPLVVLYLDALLVYMPPAHVTGRNTVVGISGTYPPRARALNQFNIIYLTYLRSCSRALRRARAAISLLRHSHRSPSLRTQSQSTS